MDLGATLGRTATFSGWWEEAAFLEKLFGQLRVQTLDWRHMLNKATVRYNMWNIWANRNRYLQLVILAGAFTKKEENATNTTVNL